MRFLKRYRVQTTSQLVRNDSGPVIEDLLPNVEGIVSPELVSEYSEIAKDFITHAAVTIGATYVICKIVGKLCR